MKFARIASSLSLLAAVGVLLYVALSRMGYPFELEWMESMSLRTVQWIGLGLPIYAAPSMEFVSYPYTPLYFYASYLLTFATGPGFVALRLISLLATLVSLMYCYRLLRTRLTANAAVFGVAFYAATYSLNGYWFDIARVDAMFMALTIAAIFYFSKHTSRDYVIAAVLFVAAAMTKQTALIIAAPLCLYALAKDRKKGLWLALPMAVLGLGIAAIAQWVTEGWFLHYTFGFMHNQLYKIGYIQNLLWHGLAKPLPILLVFSIAGMVLIMRKRATIPRADLVVIMLACIAAAVYVDSHMASYRNDRIPLHFGLAVLFAILIDRLQAAIPRASAAIGMVALLQVGMLLPGAHHQIPTEADRAAGLELRTRFAQAGKLWIPSQAYNFDASRPSLYTHFLPASDMLQHDRSASKEPLIRDLEARLLLVDTLILEGGYGPSRSVPLRNRVAGPLIRRHFVLVDSLFGPGDERMYPVTGERRRPQYLYVRR